MGIYLLGIAGLVILFLTITYAVRYGIDSSNQIKSLKTELRTIKKQIQEFEKARE